MKKIAITLCALTILSYGFAQEVAVATRADYKISPETATFHWEATTHDFGKIKAGLTASHAFSFTNTGKIALVISSVKASCGCTVTAYSKDPVLAGGEGFVKATYRADTPGQFSKTVTINANTGEGVVLLIIKGEVVE